MAVGSPGVLISLQQKLDISHYRSLGPVTLAIRNSSLLLLLLIYLFRGIYPFSQVLLFLNSTGIHVELILCYSGIPDYY